MTLAQMFESRTAMLYGPLGGRTESDSRIGFCSRLELPLLLVAIEDKVTGSGAQIHDLRHHFASVAVSNGIDIRLVGQPLGHRDIDSTLGYAHLATGALAKSASRVGCRGA